MPGDPLRPRLRRAFRSDLWLTLAPSLMLIAIAFGITMLFVKPAPPKRIVLASPGDEGGAAYFSRRYGEILKRDGITLVVRETNGSQTNLKLLDDDESDVDVAFVQSGTDGGKIEDVYSLGSLTHTPLWVFYRGEPIEDIRDLKGRRIAVGHQDGGTQALALLLLNAAGADKAPTELFSLGRVPGLAKLLKGELDAVFVVAPAEAPIIKKHAAEKDLRILSFSRADAWIRRYPYLRKLTLPRGVFDLANDVPSQPITLISPTQNLLARDTLHPALAYLLMRTAAEVHGGSRIFENAGEFPNGKETGFPLSAEAKRYYQQGVPFLQRYLPFWAANLVDRLWVMLVPIIAVAVPLGRAVPAIYRWRIRSRVFRWYARLKQIEVELDTDPDQAALQDMLHRLDEIEGAVNKISTPLAYADNLYFFREHVDIVRRRISRRLHGEAAPERSHTPAA